MNDPINPQIDPRKKRHVTECPRGDSFVRSGDDAEGAVWQYLLDNLTIRAVGDYRILVNYHLPVRTYGTSGTLEIDLVIINKFGVFLLEVKDWMGKIVAYDDTWLKDGRNMKGNPLVSIDSKARIFKSHWFGNSSDLGGVSVKGLVVLARGKAAFENRSSFEEQSIIGIDQALLKVVNPPAFLLKPDHRKLTDEEIENIKNNLYKKHTDSGEVLIEDYRIGNQLLPGDVYKAYEAVNQNLPSQRVRIKVYQHGNLAEASEKTKLRIRRDADAVSKLGPHRNILYTLNFFPDPERSDLYYEVTELIDGERLDKMMARRDGPLAFKKQLDYLDQLCDALAHAHRQGVFHRNICPETVYVTKDGIVKLGDFDFAKVEGVATIVDPKQPLLDKDFTPPELYPNATNATPSSDLYSLGCLWLYLASWPTKKMTFNSIQNLPLPKPALHIMQTMVSEKPANRPQNAEILQKRLKELSR